MSLKLHPNLGLQIRPTSVVCFGCLRHKHAIRADQDLFWPHERGLADEVWHATLRYFVPLVSMPL
jgi:hypothetical protein